MRRAINNVIFKPYAGIPIFLIQKTAKDGLKDFKAKGGVLTLEDLAAWRKSKDVEYHETVDRADESWKGNVGVITTLIPKVHIEPKKTMAVVAARRSCTGS
jgi:hypothetical protein